MISAAVTRADRRGRVAVCRRPLRRAVQRNEGLSGCLPLLPNDALMSEYNDVEVQDATELMQMLAEIIASITQVEAGLVVYISDISETVSMRDTVIGDDV